MKSTKYQNLLFGVDDTIERIENIPAGASYSLAMHHDEFIVATVVTGDRSESWIVERRVDGKFYLGIMTRSVKVSGRPSFLILLAADLLFPLYILAKPLRVVYTFLKKDYLSNRAMLDNYNAKQYP